MSTNLYVFFESTEDGATVPACIRDPAVPGFALYEGPLTPEIAVADEPPAPVRLTFYTQNHFRIFVADLAIKFDRAIPPPPEVTAGERALREAVLRRGRLRLRRWILAEEGWDDDDNARVEVLADGSDVGALER